MTKEEFARRWDSDNLGGGITMNDVADCAVAWNITPRPKSLPVDQVLRLVHSASGAITPVQRDSK